MGKDATHHRRPYTSRTPGRIFVFKESTAEIYGGVTLWVMNETAKRGTIEPKLFAFRAAPCPWRNAKNARKRPSEVALVCKTTVQGNRAQRSRGLI